MRTIMYVVSIALFFAAISYAGVPNEIRYSGRLKSYQVPVSGSTPMRFTLYGDSEGTQQLWTSGDVEVTVSSGIFSYVFAPQNVDWRKKDIWLELRVSGRTLLPREKVTAQMYAMHSASSESLSSNGEVKISIGTTTVYLGIQGDNLYFKRSQSAQPQYLSGVPAGTVISFAGPQSKAPAGYLLCNGDPVSKHTYPELYDAIGVIYGGDGNPNFYLPDFRGLFLRGAGERTIVNYPNKGGVVNTTYKSASLGVFQGDSIREIGGTIGGGTGSGNEFLGEGLYADGAFGLGNLSNKNFLAGSGSGNNMPSSFDFSANRVVPTSSENRPANYAVNYYIKY
jgi:hypothetical protein